MKRFLFISLLLTIATSTFSLLPINKNEISGINRIIEESKLKKDISDLLYDFWELEVFKDISILESNNINLITTFYEKYNLENPLTDNTNGVFTSLYIKKLYTDFKSKSKDSEFEALRLAATLEDLILYDLNDLLLYTNNKDLKDLYIKLRYNSISQIRAINLIIRKKYRDDYKSQFLSPQDLKAILLN